MPDDTTEAARTAVSAVSYSVPFNDLRRQTEAMRAALERAVLGVMDSGKYVLGPNVSAFQDEFARYCGARHCVGVANGTDALELALRAFAPAPGGEVITVANAGMYGTSAILAIGAKPLFADIDPATMTMSPDSLARHISTQTAAVVVTHLYGQLADMEALTEITARYEVPLIEDCAQAHGAERNGRKAGAIGTVGCFSFYPTKNLGALGDAGALVTNDDGLASTLLRLRQYGWARKYEAVHPIGRNSRLDELQAAILRTKLPYLDGWNARRREIIRRYSARANAAITVPNPVAQDHVGHLCVVRSRRRAALREYLAAKGIVTEIHFPVPDHRQSVVRDVAPSAAALQITDATTAEILSLPCFPEMTEEEIAWVCEALAEFDGASR